MLSAITLSIPARPDYVHILRSVTATIAAQLNFSFDDIEDLRLAIDEACAYLLGVPAEKTVITMQIAPDGTELELLASVDAGTAALPPADAQQTVMWHILAALTDEARFEETEGGPAIRLTKRLPE